MAGLIGKKIGMTQIFQEDGRVERVTAIQAGPCFVTGLRNAGRDGYDAVQLAFDEVAEKRLSKPAAGLFKKTGAPAARKLVEFHGEPADFVSAPAEGAEAAEGGVKIGDKVTVAIFEKGQTVKVSGVSKGKGFQGTVKRHNFSRGPVTHGSHNTRAPGSIGQSADPARVFKGIRGPGQMGNERVTQLGLQIVDVLAEDNVLLVRGSVPGPKGGYVEVRNA
ncbi:MAG: 50S ribosomal protein L3 [Thermoleophilia bacterium]|nr:50S ribosomal protein L3 [Thermoleophilia bacterium]